MSPVRHENIFFTIIYVYIYFLGQIKPFATSNRDWLDTPQINPNVQGWGRKGTDTIMYVPNPGVLRLGLDF